VQQVFAKEQKTDLYAMRIRRPVMGSRQHRSQEQGRFTARLNWKPAAPEIGSEATAGVFPAFYTASVTQAWTRSMATAQRESVLTVRFSSSAVSLARPQIASQAFILASSTDVLLS
jgi:hypothetical protein